MKSFLAALQFLTAIPIRARLDEAAFERAPAWFPATGLCIGILAALADAALAPLGFPLPLRAVFAAGFLAALSGGLHLDGLADTADGLLSARPRERALEIMRDSRIGTMGALALFFILSAKIAALSALAAPAARMQALLLAPLAGRCVQLALLNLQPYARKSEGGLADIFLRRRSAVRAIWAAAWLFAGCFAAFGIVRGVAAAAAVTAAALAFSCSAQRRIGGFTGDTLGAASEIAETVVLIFAAANLASSA